MADAPIAAQQLPSTSSETQMGTACSTGIKTDSPNISPAPSQNPLNAAPIDNPKEEEANKTEPQPDIVPLEESNEKMESPPSSETAPTVAPASTDAQVPAATPTPTEPPVPIGAPAASPVEAPVSTETAVPSETAAPVQTPVAAPPEVEAPVRTEAPTEVDTPVVAPPNESTPDVPPTVAAELPVPAEVPTAAEIPATVDSQAAAPVEANAPTDLVSKSPKAATEKEEIAPLPISPAIDAPIEAASNAPDAVDCQAAETKVEEKAAIGVAEVTGPARTYKLLQSLQTEMSSLQSQLAAVQDAVRKTEAALQIVLSAALADLEAAK